MASACTLSAQQEERCPYKLPVREMLTEAKELLS